MKTISAEQFKTMYGQAGLDSLNIETPQQQPSGPSLTDVVGQDIYNRADRVGQILNRPDTSAIEKGLQVFGQGAGLAANALEQTAIRIPGVKQVAKLGGSAINWLTTSDKSPIKALGNVIGSNKLLQSVVQLYDTDKNFKDTVDAVANIGRLGGEIDTAVNGANFAVNVTNKVIRQAASLKPIPDVAFNAAENGTARLSSGIMNRVARLTPSDANEFTRLSGKTPGQYLADTGNFGSPEKVIQREAQKFTSSRASADAGFERLNGVYKNGAISDALDMLTTKAREVSSANIRPPYYSRVMELASKYKQGGLDMSEINDLKRLFERNVKLGYSKLLNADKIETATNIDNALRTWQISKAKELGFRNIDAINKQTQLSKFLVDKLGQQLIGKSGLNSINLTDWIVLGGGSPGSVSAFLTKRFFSNKAIQAKIAQILGDPALEKEIMAKIDPTVENTLRGQFPEGTKPELPAGKSPKKEVNVPIEVGPASSIEPPATQIMNESLIRAKQATPRK